MPENLTQRIGAALGRNVETDDEIGDDLPQGYVPTNLDKRRSKRRVAYAQQVLAGSPAAAILSQHVAEHGPLDGESVDSINALRKVLAAQDKDLRRDDMVRMARMLLIDASRILQGAAPSV